MFANWSGNTHNNASEKIFGFITTWVSAPTKYNHGHNTYSSEEANEKAKPQRS